MNDSIEKKICEEIQQIMFSNIPNEQKIERLAYLHAKLPKKNDTITLSEVLLQPTKYFKQGGIKEIREDLRINAKNPTSKPKLRVYNLGLNIALFTSFGVWSIPHELIHAGVNKLTGGTNLEIVLNKLYGADLWQKIIPEIQSKIMIPFIGGYVQTQNNGIAGDIATTLSPYLMTPLGIYFVKKSGEKNNNLIYWTLGAGLLASHAGGVIGDFFTLGREITGKVCETVYKKPKEILAQETFSILDTLAFCTVLVGGFLLGNRIMGYTYRLSKGLVNSAKNYFNK